MNKRHGGENGNVSCNNVGNQITYRRDIDMKKALCLLVALALVLAVAPVLGMADAGQEPIVITAFVEGDPTWDYSQNYSLNYLEEKTGVRIDPTGYVFSSQEAPTQKQLLLASGDYPEIFLMGDSSSFTFSEILTYGVKEGMFIPLNDLIANAPRLSELYELRPEYYNMHVASDGNIYSICRFSECGHCRAAAKLYVNMDWLDKLGLSVPTTTEEYYDMLVAFKENDPNGNGQADEIPLTGMATWVNGFLNAFLEITDANETYVAAIDGKIEFQANKEEFREALRYLNKMYSEGLVDTAIFTQESSQFKQTVGNDPTLVGAFIGAIYSVDMQNPYVYENYRAIEPLIGPEGVQLTSTSMFINMNLNGYFTITDKCANPEAAIAWVDAAMQPEASIIRYYGAEGHGWQYAEAGQQNILGGDYVWQFLEDSDQYTNEEFSAGPILGLKEHRAQWSPMADDEQLYSDPTIFEARIESETENLYAPYLISPVPNTFFLDGDETSKYNDLKTTISDYVEMSIAQFVTGAKSLDNDWDQYLSDLQGYGVDQYVELMQKGYDQVYGTAQD